ncbi:DUF397 domain-containing protein [Streptomyces sp. NPDC050085]|uniref:DUF397 domain-containing protein n=1 Tax=Streptomyces sp. NPDC050085 TaxID=3365600 RepID=UPI0037ACD74D
MRNSTLEHDLNDASWTWHKSSYSGGEGSNCVEVATWHKSSYSGGDGSDCLEVTYNQPGLIPVRDSKDPAGPKLTFRAAAWSAFVAGLARQA